jgi:L-rhamnose mutarotase
MQRMGMLVSLKPNRVEEYRDLHRAVWPEILRRITECNIRNYTIFLKEPENLLFGYWEYVGSDFDADMQKMAADRDTRRWWAICKPCQEPVGTRKEGEGWAMMEEVFHSD